MYLLAVFVQRECGPCVGDTFERIFVLLAI